MKSVISTLYLVAVLATGQQVEQLAIVDDPALAVFAKRSTDVKNAMRAFASRARPVYQANQIIEGALAYSDRWVTTMLHADLVPADAWRGYVSVAGDREYLVRHFQSRKASVTWSDAVLGVAIHTRTADAYVLVSNEEAQEFIEGRLQDILKLPRIPAGTAEYKLFEHEETSEGRPIWSGYVNRNVAYGEPILVAGKENLPVLHVLEWHHNLFVVTDGRTLVIRTRLIDGSGTVGVSPHAGSTGATRFIKGGQYHWKTKPEATR